MLDRRVETYEIWAPKESLWTRWAKPVLFTQIPRNVMRRAERSQASVRWLPFVQRDTAVIVDLSGNDSIEEGMSLAHLGYRPVPLYNGVYAQSSQLPLINNIGIATALFEYAEELSTYPLRPDAPPAFLLDADRMKSPPKVPGSYDNRWCVFAQDMPSATFLLQNGIRRVVVRTDKLQDDLAKVLLRYQEAQIAILTCDGETQSPVTVTKTTRLQEFAYRFKTTLGLTRNAAGGFGGKIPEPQQANTSGGHIYYGMG